MHFARSISPTTSSLRKNLCTTTSYQSSQNAAHPKNQPPSPSDILKYHKMSSQAGRKLPFLVHGQVATVSSISAVVSFISSLAGARDFDASLSTPQRAKQTAGCSHVEANIRDLVFCSLDDNSWKFTNPTKTSILPIPQPYDVPGRIRETRRLVRTLEAAGVRTQATSGPEKDSFGER
ncbi:hypothetical protein BDR03DRAFT_1014808 [Suillus americanus]|nr:hypothetical protein BDR03DRAFT_1014808 [Suillus americanus]